MRWRPRGHQCRREFGHRQGRLGMIQHLFQRLVTIRSLVQNYAQEINAGCRFHRTQAYARGNPQIFKTIRVASSAASILPQFLAIVFSALGASLQDRGRPLSPPGFRLKQSNSDAAGSCTVGRFERKCITTRSAENLRICCGF